MEFVIESVIQLTNQSASQSFIQPISQPVSQSVSQPVSQSASQSVTIDTRPVEALYLKTELRTSGTWRRVVPKASFWRKFLLLFQT